jgi:transposase
MKTQDTIEEKGGLIKIAIDMHLKSYRVVRQFGYQRPQPAQKFNPGAFYLWLRKQIGTGGRVVVCYEAGCFGYEPARRMQQMGAEVYIVAPQNWDEQHKRQVNDKLDATIISQHLSNYLAGDKKALSIVRIPSREEEAHRAPARLREQLRREIRRLQAMGRSLLLQREMVIAGRWWTGRSWAQIQQAMPAWVIEQLSAFKAVIEAAMVQATKLEAQIEAAAPKAELLRGEGALSHELLWRELIDPQRFKNARSVGNYFGLCPSESSSGERRRLGSITKHGNRRLRSIMVEMAWRIFFYQPQYLGVKKWAAILGDKKAGASARKRAIVALARQLAVDLWRIATGRINAGQLGLKLAQTA